METVRKVNESQGGHMKRLLWIVMYFTVFMFSPCLSVYAETEVSNPASKEYVDKVFADLQKQIDALNGQLLVTETTIDQGVIP